MNNLMIDLETMGNKPAAPIVAIGAVFFDPKSGELGAEFYVAVNLASAMEQGATPDGATILWWLKQSAEARAAICTDDTRSITFALSELSSFISRNSDNPRYLKVWGNGANFDNVILRSPTNAPAKPARGNSGTTATCAPWCCSANSLVSIPSAICHLMVWPTTHWPMPATR